MDIDLIHSGRQIEFNKTIFTESNKRQIIDSKLHGEVCLAFGIMINMMRRIRNRLKEPYHILREDHRKEMEVLLNVMAADIGALELQIQSKINSLDTTRKRLPRLILNDAGEPDLLNLISQMEKWRPVIGNTLSMDVDTFREKVKLLANFYFQNVSVCLVHKRHNASTPTNPYLVLQPPISRLGLSIERLCSACDLLSFGIAAIREDFGRARKLVENTPFWLKSTLYEKEVIYKNAGDTNPRSKLENISNRSFSNSSTKASRSHPHRKPKSTDQTSCDSDSLKPQLSDPLRDDKTTIEFTEHNLVFAHRKDSSSSQLPEPLPTIEEISEHHIPETHLSEKILEKRSEGEMKQENLQESKPPELNAPRFANAMQEFGELREVGSDALEMFNDLQRGPCPKTARHEQIEPQITPPKQILTLEDLNESSIGSTATQKPPRPVATLHRVQTPEYVYQLSPTTSFRSNPPSLKETKNSPPKLSWSEKVQRLCKGLYKRNDVGDNEAEDGSKSSQRQLPRSFPIPDSYSIGPSNSYSRYPHELQPPNSLPLLQQQPRAIGSLTNNPSHIRRMRTNDEEISNRGTSAAGIHATSASFPQDHFTYPLLPLGYLPPVQRPRLPPDSIQARQIPKTVYGRTLQDHDHFMLTRGVHKQDHSDEKSRHRALTDVNARLAQVPGSSNLFYRFPRYPSPVYEAHTTLESDPVSYSQPQTHVDYDSTPRRTTQKAETSARARNGLSSGFQHGYSARKYSSTSSHPALAPSTEFPMDRAEALDYRGASS